MTVRRSAGVALLAMAVCCAVRSDAPVAGPTVQLPPFVVQTSAFHPIWSYARLGRFEVLSACDDRATASFLHGFAVQASGLNRLLPDAMQARFAAPTGFILITNEQEHALSGEMLKAAGIPAESRGAIHVPTHLRLADEDSLQMFVVLDPLPGVRTVAIGPDYVRFLAERRIPPLPAWYREGLERLYDRAHFSSTEVVFPPETWMTPEITARLRADPSYPRALIPFPTFFRGPPAAHPERWSAQAELFLRWAASGLTSSRLKALWALADLPGARPPTDDEVRAQFGVDAFDLRETVLDYLPRAVRDPIPLVNGVITIPAADVHGAAPATIARILGDWERKEISLVRASYPAKLAPYEGQADRTLLGRDPQLERDPDFAAVAGLYAAERGREDLAIELLGKAVAARVRRPRVYTELARLRCARAGSARFDKATAESVLELLAAARRLDPPQLETFLVLRWVREHSPGRLTAEQNRWLDEGRRDFPGRGL